MFGEDFPGDYEKSNEKKPPHEENLPDTTINLWSTFRQETTLHGANRIGATSTTRSVIWTLLLLTSTGYLLYLLVEEFKYYFQYPYSTSISMHAVDVMPFPAVTICNMSPINKSKVVKDPRDDNYYLSISSSMYFLADDIDWNDTYYKDNGYFEPRSFQNVSDESLDLSSFILTSNFDSESNLNFSQKVTRFGMCYTWNKEGNRTTTFSGALMNLNIILNIHKEFNYLSLESAEGVKVVVHDPEEEPNIENRGFVVPPGHLSFATLTKTKYAFLPSPYMAFENDRCVDTRDSSFNNPVHPQSYSVARCRQKCIADIAYQTCGCINVGDIGDYPYCSLYQYKACYISIIGKMQDVIKSKCECPEPCSRTEYDIGVSYVVYPSDYVADKWVNSNLSSSLSISSNFTKEYIRSNAIQLRLYFEELKYYKINQVPKYTSVGDVLSNIGGQMGLFIGASFLTVTESVEYVLFILMICIRKMILNNKVSGIKNKNNN